MSKYKCPVCKNCELYFDNADGENYNPFIDCVDCGFHIEYKTEDHLEKIKSLLFPEKKECVWDGYEKDVGLVGVECQGEIPWHVNFSHYKYCPYCGDLITGGE